MSFIRPEDRSARLRRAGMATLSDASLTENEIAQIDAINSTSSYCRTLFFSYLALGTTLFILVSGTTHEDLLRETPVKMPLFDIGVPLLTFYAVAPFLFVLFHINLLNKLSQLRKQIEKLVGAEKDSIRGRLFPFDYALLFGGFEQDWLEKSTLWIIVGSTLFAMPVLLLLYTQYKFLAYHSDPMTVWHSILVVIDVLTLWFFHFVDRKGRRVTEGTLRGFLATLMVFFALAMLVPPDRLWDSPISKDYWSGAHQSGLYRDLRLEGAEFWATEPSPVNIASFDEKHDFDDGAILQARLRYGKPMELRGRDLRYANLVRVKLIEAELTGAELHGTNLNGAHLEGATLDGAQFLYATLVGTHLGSASLIGAQFEEADLSRAQLVNANLSFARFENAKLGGARLENARLEWANLRRVDLNRANLQDVNLELTSLKEVDFSWAQLKGATLIGAKLQGAKFLSAQLQAANLERAQLQGVNLVRAQLQGANLERAQLQGANLEQAQLQGANLERAHLQGVDFYRAKLEGANLERAQLQGAQMVDIMLQGADLSGANLQAADLASASLQGAVFESARFQWADFTGASAATPSDEDRDFYWSKVFVSAASLPAGARRDQMLERFDAITGRNTIPSFEPQQGFPERAANSRPGDQESFRNWPGVDQVAYDVGLPIVLADLACENTYIANGIASHRIANGVARHEIESGRYQYTVREVALARVLLSHECRSGKPFKLAGTMSEEVNERLREVIDSDKRRASGAE